MSIEYEGGVTASFTATAFTGYQFRMPWFLLIRPAYLPDPRQALAAHHLTWAAEQARLTASVIDQSAPTDCESAISRLTTEAISSVSKL